MADKQWVGVSLIRNYIPPAHMISNNLDHDHTMMALIMLTLKVHDDTLQNTREKKLDDENP